MRRLVFRPYFMHRFQLHQTELEDGREVKRLKGMLDGTESSLAKALRSTRPYTTLVANFQDRR